MPILVNKSKFNLIERVTFSGEATINMQSSRLRRFFTYLSQMLTGQH